MAINFPTSPTTNVTTHTHNNVTYLWDGVSWVAQGSTSLPTASSTVLGGIKIGNRLTINAGVLEADVQGGTYDNSDVDTHLNQSNPTSGHVLSWNGSDYAWVAADTGASVTVSDNAPAGPSAGDLWWDSDNGRLKVYYTDATPDSQWVDASPLGDSVSQLSGTMTGHIIPDTNAAYDFGSAEYKIRHLFLSDNSLKFVDDNNTEHSLSVSSGKLHNQGKEVLANCVFTGLDNNDTLKYNGTNWVNAAAEAPSAPAFQSSWRIPL